MGVVVAEGSGSRLAYARVRCGAVRCEVGLRRWLAGLAGRRASSLDSVSWKRAQAQRVGLLPSLGRVLVPPSPSEGIVMLWLQHLVRLPTTPSHAEHGVCPKGRVNEGNALS